MTKTLSPPKKPPRVSVPLSPELLSTFERMGKATNQGTGAAIAEWLADTHEAADLMANMLERARQSPKQVMREMHAYALGLADETGDVVRKMTAKGIADRAGAAGAAVAGTAGADLSAHPQAPPSCNTGGKVSGAKKRKPGGESS